MILPKEPLEFAIEAHGTQTRKYTHEPYITHPISVALILQQHYPQASYSMIAAALLHDVVEDTSVTLEYLNYHFGSMITGLVRGLTDHSRPENGNRKVRKKIDRRFMAIQDAPVQIIKCADLIHNTTSIVAHSPEFAKVYLPEAYKLLRVMRVEVKDSAIWKYAMNQVKTHLNKELTNEQ